MRSLAMMAASGHTPAAVRVPPVRWRQVFVWGLLAALVAAGMQWTTAAKDGDGQLATLLAVAEGGAPEKLIEAELGPVPTFGLLGHDGQLSYLVARDLYNTKGYAAALDTPGVRYRRPLYPALSSGFGSTTPYATLVGLAVWSVIGMAIAAAAAADLGRLLGGRSWAPLGVVISYGLFHAVTVSAPDALALAFVLVATALFVRGRVGWSCLSLVAAVLTKETSIVMAAGLGASLWFAGRRPWGLAVVGVPAIAVVAWMAVVRAMFPDAPLDNTNVDWVPFMGIVRAAPTWSGAMALMNWLTVVALAAGPILALILRNRLLWWTTAAWTSLAVISSAEVWRADAPRVFATGYALAFLATAVVVERHDPEVHDVLYSEPTQLQVAANAKPFEPAHG